jgi:hypothetical protein
VVDTILRVLFPIGDMPRFWCHCDSAVLSVSVTASYERWIKSIELTALLQKG